MKLIFFGPPGAGKGTQAVLVCKAFGLVHISTGDILRQHLRDKTPLGEQAQAFINKGELVPDDVILSIVEERVAREDCANGFALDGFPRTIAQAEALGKMMKLDAVINLVVPFDRLIERMTSRRVCRDCGSTHAVEALKDGACAHCGGEVYQRDDDTVETVSNRLRVYEEQTKPVLAFYERQGLVRNIDGDRPVMDVFADISDLLEREQ